LSSEVPIAAVADGVRVTVRLSPRARADRLEGIAQLADGTPVLKVSVTAPPAEGRANDALLQVLAKEWDLPRRDLAIVSGKKSRSKIVRVAGDPLLLLRRLTASIASLAKP
jgi:uncharacterized protein (TIGR00251 family)